MDKKTDSLDPEDLDMLVLVNDNTEIIFNPIHYNNY